MSSEMSAAADDFAGTGTDYPCQRAASGCGGVLSVGTVLKQEVGRAEQDGILREKALEAGDGSGVAVELAGYMVRLVSYVVADETPGSSSVGGKMDTLLQRREVGDAQLLEGSGSPCVWHRRQKMARTRQEGSENEVKTECNNLHYIRPINQPSYQSKAIHILS